MLAFENHDNYFHVKASGKLTHENYVDHLTPKFEYLRDYVNGN